MRFAFSVDLEPNKDRSWDGIRKSMSWFDDVIPRGTVFTTYNVAVEMPDLLASLTEDHEIGVHVHPVEFGHGHDELAQLTTSRRRELIQQTREAIAESITVSPSEITSFRAGRHSANAETLDILTELDFDVDASAHVNYESLPPELREIQ